LKATPSIDWVTPKPEEKSLSRFGQTLQKVYRNFTSVVNGKIGYGDGTNSDNIDGVWKTVTFPTANTNLTITHNLGRIPVGYHVMTKSAATDIFNGTLPSTSTQITLQSTQAGVTISFFIV